MNNTKEGRPATSEAALTLFSWRSRTWTAGKGFPGYSRLWTVSVDAETALSGAGLFAGASLDWLESLPFPHPKRQKKLRIQKMRVVTE